MLQPKKIKNEESLKDKIESLQIVLSSVVALHSKSLNYRANVSGPTSITDRSIYNSICCESHHLSCNISEMIKEMGGDVVSDLVSHSKLSIIDEVENEKDANSMALSMIKSLNTIYSFCEDNDVEDVDKLEKMCKKMSYILESSR